jgi:arylsulfatase A-like enzyme
MHVPRWLWLLLLLLLVRPTQANRRVRAEPLGDDQPRPNIVILVTDDQTAGVMGIDGDPRRATPRLDALARQGVRFDRAYCNAPVCTASRQSFITGRYPHAVGVTLLPTPLPDDAVTLGDWLGDLGYTTGAIGKMHFNSPARHGFQERLDAPDWQRWLRQNPPEGGDQRRPWKPFQDPASVWLNAATRDMGLPESAMPSTFYADRAIEFLRRHKGEPFALVVGFPDPHSPFNFPRELAGTFRPEQFDVPEVSDRDRQEQPVIFAPLTSDDVRGIQASYFTSLHHVDHQIGRVLDALDAEGLADNTIVVVLGDNGYMLGQHGRFEKHVLYEPAVRVPLIVRWTGRLPAGRRVIELVELVDLLPTLLDLAGLPRPPDLHGVSLTPLLRDEPDAKGRETVFSEYLENEEAMIRSSRYKLIVGTGRRHRQDGYATANPLPGPSIRLFDMESDPDETTNLADEPDVQLVKERLLDELHRRLTTTRGDRGPVPPGLSRLEAIHWCLVPRDLMEP